MRGEGAAGRSSAPDVRSTARRLAAAATLLVAAHVASASGQANIALTVVVHGLRNQRGHARVALYADASSWARPHREVASCAAVIHGAEASCQVRVPHPGRYAVAVLHDEDDDGAITCGAFGWPLEGYGFSNRVRQGLLPPAFERASFLVSGPAQSEVTVRYGL